MFYIFNTEYGFLINFYSKTTLVVSQAYLIASFPQHQTNNFEMSHWLLDNDNESKRDDEQWQYQIATQKQKDAVYGFARTVSKSLDGKVHIFNANQFPKAVVQCIYLFYLLSEEWDAHSADGDVVINNPKVYKNSGNKLLARGRYAVALSRFIHQKINFEWIVSFEFKHAPNARFHIGFSDYPDWNSNQDIVERIYDPSVPLYEGQILKGCFVAVLANNKDTFMVTLSLSTVDDCWIKAVGTLKKKGSNDEILGSFVLDNHQIGAHPFSYEHKVWCLTIFASKDENVERVCKIIRFTKSIAV